jgi:hypothetical protein
MRNAHADADRFAKWYTYFYPDTYGGSLSYTYCYSSGHSHRNTLTDAYVRGGRHAWSVDERSAGRHRSLRWVHG